MNRLIPMLAAVSLLLPGCGNNPQQDAATAAGETTTQVSENEATTPTETTTAAENPSDESTAAEKTETSAATQTTAAAVTTGTQTAPQEPAASQEDSPAAASETGGTLTRAVADRLRNLGDDSVTVTLTETTGGEESRLTSMQSGGKARSDVLFGGGIEICSIFDGQNTYSVDAQTKTYCIEEAGSIDDEMFAAEEVLDEATSEAYAGSGTAEYNGKLCRYEEFLQSADGSAENVYRYYFDDAGNLIATVASDLTEESDFSFTFSVIFGDVDPAAFTLPADYREISTEEMGEQMMARMFAMMNPDEAD